MSGSQSSGPGVLRGLAVASTRKSAFIYTGSGNNTLGKTTGPKVMKKSWKQRFVEWVSDYSTVGDDTVGGFVLKAVEKPDCSVSASNKLRFSVIPARGGSVVEIEHYDAKTDRHNNVIYVIPDENDVAMDVGRIVSLELIRA